MKREYQRIDMYKELEQIKEIKRLTKINKELLAELSNIANADYRQWDSPYNNAEQFVLWAKSRTRFALQNAELRERTDK